MTSTTTCPSRIDDLVRMAVQWAPYGGVDDEDAMVAFGLSREQFYQRLADILATGAPGWLTPPHRQRLATAVAQFPAA